MKVDTKEKLKLVSSRPRRKRVTINLSVRDAKNLAGHLNDTFAPSPEREKSIRKAQDKLARKLA